VQHRPGQAQLEGQRPQPVAVGLGVVHHQALGNQLLEDAVGRRVGHAGFLGQFAERATARAPGRQQLEKGHAPLEGAGIGR